MPSLEAVMEVTPPVKFMMGASTPSPMAVMVEIAFTVVLPPEMVIEVSECIPSSVELIVFVPLIIEMAPSATIVLGCA